MHDRSVEKNTNVRHVLVSYSVGYVKCAHLIMLKRNEEKNQHCRYIELQLHITLSDY